MGTIIAGLSFILFWTLSYGCMSLFLFEQNKTLKNSHHQVTPRGNEN